MKDVDRIKDWISVVLVALEEVCLEGVVKTTESGDTCVSGYYFGNSSCCFINITYADGSDCRLTSISCFASNCHDPKKIISSPRILNRKSFPTYNLLDELQKTLDERREILQRIESGYNGPYSYGIARWSANINE